MLFFLLSVAPVSIKITGSVGTPTAGESYSLTCDLSGADLPITVTAYRWRKDGIVLAGETADVLSFSPFRLSDAGQYTCEITVENRKFSNTQVVFATRKMFLCQAAG